jgi:23S rRNA-/tRNA-specific pseudouridylate synthase
MSTATSSSSAGPIRFRVVGIEDGMMLRQLLGKRLKVPPAVAAEIVRAGGAYVGPVRMCVPTVRVTEGERVTVYPVAAKIAAVEPETLRLLHRDDNCVIVDKSHGVPAAATRAANRGTLAHALVQRLTQEGVLRPYVGLVHSLPAAAAGLALYTIRSQATESFYKEFAALPMRRAYRVRLRGSFPGERIECAAPITHAAFGGGVWRLARAGDREPIAARTEFIKLAELGEETLVSVELAGLHVEAIRLHAAALGLPIVGDGEADATLCLLAEALAFTQPRSGAAISVRASLPAWAALAGEVTVPVHDLRHEPEAPDSV